MLEDDDKRTLDELRKIQKSPESWKSNIGDVAAKLDEDCSINVKAKALWVLGEMGLSHPGEVEGYLDEIVGYLDDEHPKLRERTVNALGRIGRANVNLAIPYFNRLMKTRYDEADGVRLAFVWACENIAINAPDLFCERLDVFYELFDDSSEKVRIESPEMFRVIGKRRPQCVKPYLEKLQKVADTNEHPVVRIHCEGAIRITKKALDNL